MADPLTIVNKEILKWTVLQPARKNITATKVWVDAPQEKPQIYFKLY